MKGENEKYVAIDYEYSRGANKDMELVCVSLLTSDTHEATNIWLHNHNKEGQKELNQLISKYRDEGYVFLAYAATSAEGRAMINHGFDPRTLKWVDLYLEYACLLNNNHKLMFGKQLIEGKEVVTYPTLRSDRMRLKGKKSDDKNRSKPEKSLAACAYKLLGVKIDTDHKDKVRDLIIHGSKAEIQQAKQVIMDYCASDVKYLYEILMQCFKWYKKLLRPADTHDIFDAMLFRGEFAVRTSYVVDEGYGLDFEAAKNFSTNTAQILRDKQREIVERFPDLHIFEWDVRKAEYTFKQDNTRAVIRRYCPELMGKWDLTKSARENGGDSLSLSLDVFEKFFSWKHDEFPDDNPVAQVMSYLKLKKELFGFLPAKKKGSKTFWDSVGQDDHHSRPFQGLAGAQSERCQPPSTGFLFLKPAWMRALCTPPRGYMYVGIDFGSEEILIGGLLSQDMNLIRSYLSGDPYLAFAKLAKAVPPDATKESHPKIRNRFKSTTLGVGYGMEENSLAAKLTQDTKEPVSVAEARHLINLYRRAYPVFDAAKDEWVDEYENSGYLLFPDGWVMFGDNDNKRSIKNVPIQHQGVTALKLGARKIQELEGKYDIKIIFYVHDAIYFKVPLNDWDAVDAANQAMKDAFKEAFKGFPDKVYNNANIRTGINAWSKELAEPNYIVHTPKGEEVEAQQIYIDSRAVASYEKFSNYFDFSLDDMSSIL